MSFNQMKRILPITCGCLLFAALLYASGGEGGHKGVQWMDLIKRTINFAALVFFLWYLIADKIKNDSLKFGVRLYKAPWTFWINKNELFFILTEGTYMQEDLLKIEIILKN